MEVALNSMVTSTQMRSTNSAMTTALPSANFRADSRGIVDFFNSKSRDFENGKVLTSSNGLALLASLTLKKALNVGNVYSQIQHKNPNIVSMLPTSNVYSFNNITAAAAATSSRTTSTTTTANITSSSNNSSSLSTSSPSSQNKNKNKDVNVTSIATITKSSSSTAVTASMTTNTKHGIATSSAITAKTTSTTTAAISNNSNNNNTNNNSNSRHNFQIPSDILDDLASRFIINVPDMELSNLIRICFQIELAHWFYLDFFCASDEEKKLKPCGIKQFAMQLFQHIPFLHEHLSSVDKILEDWKNYKLSVPTYGAILISEDLNYCLLVQSYFSKSSWGFPKGKVNENEDPEHCAAREVYEETGYDITELIVPNDYIEAVINYQFTRLYIVRNVSLQTQFSPRTRNEIKCCDWFPIDSLPAKKSDAISKTKLGINANSFFMIMPFVKRLKKWVNDIRTGIESRRKFPGGGGVCNGGGENASPTANLVSVSNTSTTATTVLVSGNFNNINNNNNNNLNINNSNNQKHLNANSNCKKNKQQKQNIDEKNALRSDIAVVGGAGGEGGLRCSGNAANTLTNSSSAAATVTLAATATATVTSSNRSKRQRHKSMGDLDGIKLNNLSHNNISNQSNCKFNGALAHSNVGATTIITTTSSTTTTANAVANNNNCNQNSNLIVGNNNNGVNGNGSNQKRNLLKIVAGSNTNNNNNNSSNNNNNSNNLNGISGNHVSTTKRQLFHNQNQNGGEKIISSFDLIRKEKQQIKAAAQAERTSKAQKQQQQINGRVRAKSQGDKMCMQQAQQPQQLQQQINNNINSINNSTNNKNNSNKQRGQKQQQQQTMIINNTTTNMSANNNVNINNQMHISTANNTVNGYVTPPLALTSAPATPTPLATPGTLVAPAATTTASSHLSGVELIALAASAAAAKTSPTTKRQNSEVVLQKSYSSAPNTVQKPRPSSVSLHFATTPTLNCDGDITAMQQLQRMASVTNLRILKRATSHQPQLHQLEQHQQLKFTPNFNSWTNFSFTKNFIANVFC